MSTKQNVVATEVAELEFDRFVEEMDIDIDPKGMDDADKAALENNKRRIVRAIALGRLVVNEAGEPVYTPQKGDNTPITFHEPNGAARMAADEKKAGHNMKKGFAIIAAATKQPITRFVNMVERDLKVIEAIGAIFFG